MKEEFVDDGYPFVIEKLKKKKRYAPDSIYYKLSMVINDSMGINDSMVNSYVTFYNSTEDSTCHL